QSLAALSSMTLVKEDLGHIADADVQASLAKVSVDPQIRETLNTHTTDGEPCSEPAPATVAAVSGGGRFRILRPHARGGLGEVFLAQDTELDREVALKEIQLRPAGHAVSRARFVTEARVTGALEHPSIVPVYGLGHYADGRPFYAMRFIRG